MSKRKRNINWSWVNIERSNVRIKPTEVYRNGRPKTFYCEIHGDKVGFICCIHSTLVSEV